MESNDHNNYGKEQPQKDARKRKLNELANDEEDDKPEECQEEPQQENYSKRNRQNEEEQNLDLELESLSHEELIKLVRKQIGTNQNEEGKQELEVAKKEESDESINANQQQQAKAKEDMIRDMDELKMAFLASQQKLEEVNAEMAKLNANYQKLFERIVQLPQKEEEEATGILTRKQMAFPVCHSMKIQLAKETWFLIMGWVPRRRLGQIVPQIGDRQFAASIAQPFLHNYGHITLANIAISGPRHRLIQHGDVPMPKNIEDFLFIGLSYLSTSVIDLLEKFQQNSLFGNVNLDLRLQQDTPTKKNTLLQTLSHVLPFIDNINSIQGANFAQLVNFYNSNNELAMAMLEMTRILAIFHDNFHFEVPEIALLNRWLYTPREDGRPRVLILPVDYASSRPNQIPDFIEGTIKEFAKAKRPVSFFILFFLPDFVEWPDKSMENATTKEMLVIKKVESPKFESDVYEQEMALVSRYPMEADKQWIEANEREAMEWNFDAQNGRICLGSPITHTIDNEEDSDSDSDDDDQSDGNDDDVNGSDSDDQGGTGPKPNYGDRHDYGDRRGQRRPLGFARRSAGGPRGKGRGGIIIGGGRQ